MSAIVTAGTPGTILHICLNARHQNTVPSQLQLSNCCPSPSCSCFRSSFSLFSYNSLFRSPVPRSSGGLSTNIDLKSTSCKSSSSEKTFRRQTFLSSVAMATVPPAIQPPQAAVGKAVPPFPCSPPPLGSSAASVRPLQQAPHAEMLDKGTKRAFVPPMTPQPLHIQGPAPR